MCVCVCVCVYVFGPRALALLNNDIRVFYPCVLPLLHDVINTYVYFVHVHYSAFPAHNTSLHWRQIGVVSSRLPLRRDLQWHDVYAHI